MTLTQPASVMSSWQIVIAAGGVDDADNSGNSITNPSTQGRSDEDHHDINVGQVGTGILCRLKADDGDTVSVAPVIEAFGWDELGNHVKLLTRGGASSVTLTLGTETDGEYLYSAVNIDDAFDAVGCKSVSVHIKTAYTASGGDASLAIVQAKVV